MKNKLKTRSSAQKRYKKTGTGKFIRRKAFKGHILEKKSAKRKRNLNLRECVSKGDSQAIKLMLPYS
jgi:large subunit ribosomal protein L35|uniref:Large ribosomal subunit protein bL35c n=1 Tax=Octactis speculum TaxID=3111310 RepID=A0A514CPI2_9STRA|nr:ribosomal protein L35 [Dictyocha speculum]QDH81710.1 ribosomal protein L35 [Dictyocha speculum]|tara:strand:- start:13156 stop:13356 length:201 start_codon:yes stop_codon:yes gene_type:complete